MLKPYIQYPKASVKCPDCTNKIDLLDEDFEGYYYESLILESHISLDVECPHCDSQFEISGNV